jgi:hypothetical protein
VRRTDDEKLRKLARNACERRAGRPAHGSVARFLPAPALSPTLSAQ